MIRHLLSSILWSSERVFVSSPRISQLYTLSLDSGSNPHHPVTSFRLKGSSNIPKSCCSISHSASFALYSISWTRIESVSHPPFLLRTHISPSPVHLIYVDTQSTCSFPSIAAPMPSISPRGIDHHHHLLTQSAHVLRQSSVPLDSRYRHVLAVATVHYRFSSPTLTSLLRHAAFSTTVYVPSLINGNPPFL